LEVSQGNMDGIKPYSPPEPSPPPPTPPPTPFPTIHVQDRNNAIAIYRINCGGGKFTDNDGNAWQADEYFNTGTEDMKTDLKMVNVAARTITSSTLQIAGIRQVEILLNTLYQWRMTQTYPI
jgi:hypothetical protein